MIHEKIEIQLKDSEFKANLFTYFLDNSPSLSDRHPRCPNANPAGRTGTANGKQYAGQAFVMFTPAGRRGK